MLTVDLLRLRTSGSEIRPVRAKRDRALPLAEALLEVFREAKGKSLEALDLEIAAVDVAATDVKIRQGLAKLLKDDLTLSSASSEDAARVRARVFLEAAARRKAGTFDRAEVLSAIAAERNENAEALEENLFCDLRGETRVLATLVPTAEDLLERYERAQEDALLMRAAVVRAALPKVSPAVFRAIFRKLKFLGLLFRVEPRAESDGGGYALTIDGPSSLFGPTTRYGISFVHLLPTLRLAGNVSLSADIRYRNKTYVFRKEEDAPTASPTAADWVGDVPEALLRALQKAAKDTPSENRASAKVCHDILEGAGEVLVPDLVLAENGRSVFVEVLGKHDRGAFFRRLEFVAATPRSQRQPLILCVPKALRVHPDLAKDVNDALAVLVFHAQPSSAAVVQAARDFFMVGAAKSEKTAPS